MASIGRVLSHGLRDDDDLRLQRVLSDLPLPKYLLGRGTQSRFLHEYVLPPPCFLLYLKALTLSTAAGVLGTWFKLRYPLVIAIAVCGSSLGGVIFPIMMDRITQSLGFPWAIRIAAFLSVVLLAIVNLTVKARTPPRPQPLRISEFAKPFAKPSFSLTVFGTCLIYFSILLPYNYVVVQARQAGMSSNLVQYLVPIMNATSVPGRLIPGYIAIRYGGYNIFIIISIISGVLCLALWLPANSNATIVTFAALYGAFGGGIFTMVSSLVIYDCPILSWGSAMGPFS
ncbi:hypothetical protein CLAIMM_10700 isoform 3 [Cladophialophora immunda]|nr:hypothetical protein CLAIMM_10700 isoform 2 [Cladophialophora immunda]OQV06068.1 hypothetical protein CLAIMM_10700 isoform 3 [Cladophialophora immunda]